MQRRAFAFLLAFAAAACSKPHAAMPGSARTASFHAMAAAGSLEGVWTVVEQASRTPGGDWVSSGTPYRSLYVFTPTHYSYMFTRPEPRPPFAGDPNRPSDAEKVRAYDSFVGAAGTYALDGTTLTLVALVHKNPSEMTGEALRYAAEIGRDTVRLTITNPPFQPGRERRTVLARLALPSPDSGESRSSGASRAPGRSPSDSVWWLRVRTESGVMLAAVARPSGAGPFPALIILHGTHGFAQEYVELARDLARRGVLGVAACWFDGHRGVGARYITPIECDGGPPFVDAPGVERFRLARESVNALVASVRALPDAQENQIALFGHSRGGGAALDYVLLHTGAVNAVVLNSAGYPPEVTARAAEVDVPILLMHGTADTPAGGGSPFTNVTMARAFEAALRNAGKGVEAVYYEGGGHETIFTVRTQYEDALQRMTTFLRPCVCTTPNSCEAICHLERSQSSARCCAPLPWSRPRSRTHQRRSDRP